MRITADLWLTTRNDNSVWISTNYPVCHVSTIALCVCIFVIVRGRSWFNPSPVWELDWNAPCLFFRPALILSRPGPKHVLFMSGSVLDHSPNMSNFFPQSGLRRVRVVPWMLITQYRNLLDWFLCLSSLPSWLLFKQFTIGVPRSTWFLLHLDTMQAIWATSNINYNSAILTVPD